MSTQASDSADDSDASYVYISLAHMDVDQLPAPGTSISLQNLNSLMPELVLPNGTVLKGKYEETIGSFLFFTKPASPAADATDTATAIQPQFIGHTEQQLVLTAKSPFVQNT